jgi:hypothetical protein
MKALFNVGYDQGKSADAFAGKPPPYAAAPATDPAGGGKP